MHMFGSFRWTRGRLAAVLGGVLLAGAVAAGGIASAQSPTPSPSPAPGAGGQGQRDGARAHLGKGDLAARLAQALGIPQDRVEQALQQLMEERRNQAGGKAGAGMGRFEARLAEVAQRLGVTEQQLRDAMRAAMQQVIGAAAPGQQGQGQRMRGQRPDPSAFFDAIAQQLGTGLTGAQVREAFGFDNSQGTGPRQGMGPGRGPGTPPGTNRPDRAQIEARAEEFLQRFADLLGVTVDQLREALRQLGGPGMGRRGR
jgi:hypothetical protein